MNFAQELHHAESVKLITQWLSTPRTGSNAEKWLLFDGAILGEKLTNTLIKTARKSSIYNIFDKTPFSSYGLLSPYLIRLDSGARVSNTLDTLLQFSNGLPAIAFLDANVDANQVCRNLFWLAQVITSDGFEMYLRFADTRVTYGLIEVLSSAQRSILGESVTGWRIFDRSGKFHVVLADAVPPTGIVAEYAGFEAQREQLTLSDSQYVLMMKLAETDEIFQMLCEGAPRTCAGTMSRRLLH